MHDFQLNQRTDGGGPPELYIEREQELVDMGMSCFGLPHNRSLSPLFLFTMAKIVLLPFTTQPARDRTTISSSHRCGSLVWAARVPSLKRRATRTPRRCRPTSAPRNGCGARRLPANVTACTGRWRSYAPACRTPRIAPSARWRARHASRRTTRCAATPTGTSTRPTASTSVWWRQHATAISVFSLILLEFESILQN